MVTVMRFANSKVLQEYLNRLRKDPNYHFDIRNIILTHAVHDSENQNVEVYTLVHP